MWLPNTVCDSYWGDSTNAFQSLPYSLTVLENGSGPVIQHRISAAAHASEIVFSNFAERN